QEAIVMASHGNDPAAQKFVIDNHRFVGAFTISWVGVEVSIFYELSQRHRSQQFSAVVKHAYMLPSDLHHAAAIYRHVHLGLASTVRALRPALGERGTLVALERPDEGILGSTGYASESKERQQGEN